MDEKKLEAGFRLVLEGLGLDPDSQAFREVPGKTAATWMNELCSGLREDPPEVRPYPLEEGQTPGMISLLDIPVKSICAHHFLPFMGKAIVAYLPNGSYCGLSTLSKVVDYFARRPQMQEHLTLEVAHFLMDHLRALGVGVLIQASHYCMEMRGVNHPGLMSTSTLLGAFKDDPAIHAEFMALVRGAQSSQ